MTLLLCTSLGFVCPFHSDRDNPEGGPKERYSCVHALSGTRSYSLRSRDIQDGPDVVHQPMYLLDSQVELLS